MNPRPHWDQIDYLKAVALVAVVVTHSLNPVFGPNFTPLDAKLGLATLFQVPTFLIVSGFLYFRDEPVPLSQLGMRLRRILVPYLVASLVAQAWGVARAEGLSGALYQLATASALGPYYFIALLVQGILLSWPLSRTGRWSAPLLGAALLVYLGAVTFEPGWKLTPDVFWAVRSPIENFNLGYFVARPHLARSLNS